MLPTFATPRPYSAARVRVDYDLGRIRILNEDRQTYFGIFEIDGSEDRAKLRIELRRGSYPAEFSADALVYIERANLGRGKMRSFWE